MNEERNIRNDIAGMRILLAEDNGINCEIVEFMLKQAGAEVAAANDEKAAVDAETVPIIALSANAFEEDIAMAKDAGMNEHLAKPNIKILNNICLIILNQQIL